VTQSLQGRRTWHGAVGAGESGAVSRPYQQEGGLIFDQIAALVIALATLGAEFLAGLAAMAAKDSVTVAENAERP